MSSSFPPTRPDELLGNWGDTPQAPRPFDLAQGRHRGLTLSALPTELALASAAGRRAYTPPKERQRRELPDALLASARSERNLPNGAEFRFEAQPGIWERVNTFVMEERECCPFFAFEQWEEEGELVLRITRPGEE